MKRKMKFLIFSFFSIVCVVLVYLFLFGKLFAYSPLVLGFSKYELNNAVVYLQNGSPFKQFGIIDSIVKPVERFHQLQFQPKPEIFIFSDSSSYINRSVTKARLFVYPNGKLFVSPWAIKEAAEGKISLEIYVGHELSHTVLYQNMGVLAAYNYPQWLMEGIAVYSANQMGTSWYPGKKETYSEIKKGNFLYPKLFKTKEEDKLQLNVKYRLTFMYSEFACIVDYLIEKYGKEKFLTYMKSLLNNNDHDKAFKEIFNVEFDKFISDFREHVAGQTEL
jgi:hypothetical protein